MTILNGKEVSKTIKNNLKSEGKDVALDIIKESLASYEENKDKLKH